MYVYMKADGKFDNNNVVGVGKFECNVYLDMPKEVFEKKLNERKSFEINHHVFKIHHLEKLRYYEGNQAQPAFCLLPIGAHVQKKTLLQKIKTLYFG